MVTVLFLDQAYDSRVSYLLPNSDRLDWIVGQSWSRHHEGKKIVLVETEFVNLLFTN